MFYMDVRYDGSDSSESEADLVLVDRLTSTDEAAQGKLCVLLQWHESDPVDEFELERNSKVFEFQGNRNPFIDKPELASLIFNASCDGTDAGDSDGGDTGEDSGDSVDDGTDGSTGSGHAVFISEYIEGSSFNKAVEIYNGSTEAVDLSNYKLKLLSNGATVTEFS